MEKGAEREERDGNSQPNKDMSPEYMAVHTVVANNKHKSSARSYIYHNNLRIRAITMWSISHEQNKKAINIFGTALSKQQELLQRLNGFCKYTFSKVKG